MLMAIIGAGIAWIVSFILLISLIVKLNIKGKKIIKIIEKLTYILSTVIAVLVGFSINSLKVTTDGIIVVCSMFLGAVALLCIGVGIFSLKQNGEKEKLALSVKDKQPKDLTEEEKEAMLWWLKKQYDRRILSYLQYDALKSKYDGSTSIGDIVGADGIAKMQTSMIKDEIDKKEQKEETKTIVKNAVVGGIIAGPEGAVVGAVVGKNKVDNKKK